ncbi:MAG: 1-deoxy-D-xylulose-5-phosphate reductoisomerase, partial [Brevundimonas sp.]
VAAYAFLDRRLGFLNIAAVVAETLERAAALGIGSDHGDACEAALDVDRQSRGLAEAVVADMALAA